MFESVSEKNTTIQKYRKIVHIPWYNFLLGICGKKKVISKKDLLLEKYVLNFDVNVDNPSNIKWENIEIKNRAMRQCCVVFLIGVLFIITFLIVLLSNTVSNAAITCTGNF